MNFIVIDLEATRSYKDVFYLTEIGAFKLNSSLEYISHFQSFINPIDFENMYNTNSKIYREYREDLYKIKIRSVFDSFKEWIGKEEYILLFWSYSDLYLLVEQYVSSSFDLSWLTNYCDLQICFANYSKREIMTLNNAVKYLGMKFVGDHHHALVDAYNTTKILFYLYNKIELDVNYKPFEVLSCKLYKKCNACKTILSYKRFGKKKGKLRSVCRECSYKRRELRQGALDNIVD